MSRICYEYVTNMLRYVTNIGVYDSWHTSETWVTSHDTHMLRICREYVMNMLRICHEYVMNMSRICYEYVTNWCDFTMNHISITLSDAWVVTMCDSLWISWHTYVCHEYVSVKFMCDSHMTRWYAMHSYVVHMWNSHVIRAHVWFICGIHVSFTWRGGGLGSRPKKMYGERLGDGVEYHLMKPTPRR